jgi:DNA-binding response OmpR family regulator
MRKKPRHKLTFRLIEAEQKAMISGISDKQDAVTPKTRPIQVMLVEDNPAIRDFMAALLQAVGYEVQVAADAEKAIALMETVVFDLVIADLLLTGIFDGLDVLRYHQLILPEKKRMLITASNYQWLPSVCNVIGATLVRKPFRPNEVLLSIKNLLSET